MNKNQRGFSLVEVLVSTAIFGGISLAVMQLVATSKAQFKLLEVKELMSEEHVEIERVLLSRDACVNTFAGIPNITTATPAAPTNIPRIRNAVGAGTILHEIGNIDLNYFPRNRQTPPNHVLGRANAQFVLQNLQVVRANNTNNIVSVAGVSLPPNSFLLSFRFRLTDNVGRSVGIANPAIPREYYKRTVFQARFNGTQVASCNSETSSDYDGIFINDDIISPAGLSEVKLGNIDMISRLIVSVGLVPATSGMIYARHFQAISDARRKENIQTFKSTENQIEQLRGVQFNWKNNNSRDWGVVAQEVESLWPFLVNTDPHTKQKTVNYFGLLGPIIESEKKLFVDHKKILKKKERIHALLVETEKKHCLKNKALDFCK